jgi:hypothetical protein
VYLQLLLCVPLLRDSQLEQFAFALLNDRCEL